MQDINNVGIYHDSHVTRWHFDQLHKINLRMEQLNYFVTPNELNKFLNSSLPNKLACYHVPFPEETTWIDRLKQSYTQVDHTFVYCSELHERTVDQLLSLDLPNVSLFICGFIDYEFKHAKVFQWIDWFIVSVDFYKNVKPNLLQEQLLPHRNKPKKWDILLGARRTHRDFVYNYVNARPMKDNVIMTYFKRIDQELSGNDEFLLETDGLEFIPGHKICHSIDAVRYHGTVMSLSKIVPITVYNQSYYSLVAETNFFNHFNFYTEKIVKPIISGRLFVVIAGQHYLENLRKLGFKTFNNVIDESYDVEPDPVTRWTMAMAQVEYLNSRNAETVYEKIKDTIEHNRKLMLENNWYTEVADQLTLILNNTTYTLR